jgi:hypothetical protein
MEQQIKAMTDFLKQALHSPMTLRPLMAQLREMQASLTDVMNIEDVLASHPQGQAKQQDSGAHASETRKMRP